MEERFRQLAAALEDEEITVLDRDGKISQEMTCNS